MSGPPENLNTSHPVDPTLAHVHDHGHTLNELKAILLQSESVFGKLKVEELDILWEHEFNVVNASSGDGITSKFFDYTSGVSRNGPDVDIPEGESITTKERGDYGAGKEAIPGMAGRFTQEPTGDQDGYLGYYDEANGIGGGVGFKDFDEGEDGATSAGPQPYVFYEQNGEGREIVPQEKWNISPLDGSDTYPELDLTDNVLVRIPHAAYGHSVFPIKLGIVTDDANADFTYAGDGFKMYPAHAFTKPGETMLEKFDLPIEWNVSGTQNNGFTLKATACHYQGEEGRKIKRISGEGFTPQKNGGNTITLNTFPDWTYLMSFRKRTGWDGTDITPVGLSINATHDIEIQVTAGGDFTDTSYGLPDDTETEEAAVEYDIKTWDLTTDSQKTTDTTIGTDRGRREYYDTVAGDKQTPTTLSTSLENAVLASEEALALLARPATSNSTMINYVSMRNGSNF